MRGAGVSDSVTGQTVVYWMTVEVVTGLVWYGQLVTVVSQSEMVMSLVVRTVEVVNLVVWAGLEEEGAGVVVTPSAVAVVVGVVRAGVVSGVVDTTGVEVGVVVEQMLDLVQ